MEVTPELLGSGQHDHGSGIFISAQSIGQVNCSPSPVEVHPPDTSFAGAEAGTDTHVTGVREPTADEDGEPGPLGSLMGYAFAVLTLFGMVFGGVVNTFAARTPTAERVLSIPVAVGSALVGLISLAFVFAALAEVCAAGAANAARSTVGRGEVGRAAAARLNLHHARLLARTADKSAVLAGCVAALIGFLAVGGRAADRAQEAREQAATEVEKAEVALKGTAPSWTTPGAVAGCGLGFAKAQAGAT
ncbi:hypothetical protein AB0958_04295 [Streptomyces sp. NPDC006655]|uniref:hypothetical protein n=1 Tax=Streptomyces sp. NPDC006655 TaxID=3156898 RepID=UPI00345369F7